jgi:hypothetical protein
MDIDKCIAIDNGHNWSVSWVCFGGCQCIGIHSPGDSHS